MKEKRGQVEDRQAAGFWCHCPRNPPAFPGWVTTVLLPSPQVTPGLARRIQDNQTCPPSGSSRTGPLAAPHPIRPHALRTDRQVRQGKGQVLRRFRKAHRALNGRGWTGTRKRGPGSRGACRAGVQE